MTVPAAKKAKTRGSILDSAARLVRERGIAGARIADVMAGAGLTVGGFYAHFASKRALVDAALARTAAELRARLFAGLERVPPAERARVVIDRYLSAAHRDEQSLRCPLPAVVGEVATRAPEHGPAIAAIVVGLADQLAPLVPGRPARRRALALGLVALAYGGLGLARAVKDTRLSDEVLGACRSLAAAVLAPGGSS